MKHPDWDPRDPLVLRDQRAAYDAMRDTCPIAYSEFLGWSVFRHADVETVLADPATYRSASSHTAVPNGMDPPQHTLYRSALEPFFARDLMRDFEPRCRAVATNLMSGLVERREMEFVWDFAEPFALRAICVFLGWHDSRWTDLQGWTHGNQDAALSRDREAGQALAEELTRHVKQELQLRKSASAPSEDVTTRLMSTQIDGRPLNDDELVSIVRNWIAGHGTVAAGLANLAFHIARNESLQTQLRCDPTLITQAVDEILRVDGPLVANRRTAGRAVDLGGQAIGANEKITLMWIAANRDETVFPNPDLIDLDRDQSQSLVFGAGIHDCVGAPLARLELRVALEELLAKTSSITLDPSCEPVRGVYPGNGFSALRIRLEPA